MASLFKIQSYIAFKAPNRQNTAKTEEITGLTRGSYFSIVYNEVGFGFSFI